MASGQAPIVPTFFAAPNRRELPMKYHALGPTSLQVSAVALGAWPLGGLVGAKTTPQEGRDTIEAALAAGINFLDTAYSYGLQGESERLLGQVLQGRRDEAIVASKVGLSWTPEGEKVRCGRPDVLWRHAEESLQRLGMDYVDVLYLHVPDPEVPIEDSAGALRDLMDAGKTRHLGISNANVPEMEAFARICPLAVVQEDYNLVQRDVERERLPWCRSQGLAFTAYYPLMSGLLAGRFTRDYVFDESDRRKNYPIFQGKAWQRNLELVEQLRSIAERRACTLAQLAVAWLLHQPGVTSVLCGATRGAQIRETAAAADVTLTPTDLSAIDQIEAASARDRV